MARMNMVQALNSAMDVMLERDPRVVILGEDVGYFGGVFRVTEGLQRKYGEHRVLDTPIAEGGIVAAAIGMGVNGLKPVAEIQFADYIYPGFDQVVSELARVRYRSAGEFSAPVTIRTPCGGGIRGGQTHSQSPESVFTHVCGIKVVMPSNPYDAKGLLISAIEDDDPVVFFEPKRIYNGPFDGDPGGCVVVHEATGFSGYGAELVATVQEQCFWHLEAPIQRVTGWDTPYPHAFEWEYFPGPARIAAALKQVTEAA